MKRILSLFIAVAVAHFGLKIYLYQNITAQLDKMVKEVSLFAQVEYQGVSTSLLDKSFSINELEIIPAGSVAPIKIHKISFAGANFFGPPNKWFNSLNFESQSTQSVKVYGLEVDIKEYLKYGNLGQLKTNPGTKFNNLTDLGYDTLTTDFSLSLKTYPELKTIEVNYEQSHLSMFLFGFNATVAAQDYNADAFNPHQAYQNLQIINASLNFADDSFLERLFQYQAQQQGKTIAEIKKELIHELNVALKSKEIKLPQEQHQALVDLISDYKPIRFQIKPINPMGLQSFSHLHLYKPEDVAKMLNLKISNE